VHDGILVGDSGYQLTRYLMTPYLAPSTPSEERFNASLCRTRVLIEQTFGILKRRFQVLQVGLRVSPDQAIQYITGVTKTRNGKRNGKKNGKRNGMKNGKKNGKRNGMKNGKKLNNYSSCLRVYIFYCIS
jgi:hypothetical protein